MCFKPYFLPYYLERGPLQRSMESGPTHQRGCQLGKWQTSSLKFTSSITASLEWIPEANINISSHGWPLCSHQHIHQMLYLIFTILGDTFTSIKWEILRMLGIFYLFSATKFIEGWDTQMQYCSVIARDTHSLTSTFYTFFRKEIHRSIKE